MCVIELDGLELEPILNSLLTLPRAILAFAETGI